MIFFSIFYQGRKKAIAIGPLLMFSDRHMKHLISPKEEEKRREDEDAPRYGEQCRVTKILCKVAAHDGEEDAGQ